MGVISSRLLPSGLRCMEWMVASVIDDSVITDFLWFEMYGVDDFLVLLQQIFFFLVTLFDI